MERYGSRRWLPGALAATAVVLALACVDGEKEPPATPTAEQPPSVLVFLRGDDLWVAALDGLSLPRAITSGSVAAQYAGFVRTAVGDIDLYYTEQLGETDPTGAATKAALYRVGLESGVRDELFRFKSRQLSPYHSSAAVSPDGRYVLLSDFEGITLLDLSSGATRSLLANSPPCLGPQDCFGYGSPRWSPTGQRALITKTFWEGGSDIVIDPFEEPVEEEDTPGGASLRAGWSADGERICVSEFTYSSAGAVLVYDLSTGDTVDSTLGLPLPTPSEPGRLRIDAQGCAWAADGRLAFGYVVPDNLGNAREGWIAVVDASFAVLAESAPVDNLSTVVDWLPGDSGVLYNRWQPQEGRPLPPGIFDPERGLIELPFKADAVLAVIP